MARPFACPIRCAFSNAVTLTPNARPVWTPERALGVRGIDPRNGDCQMTKDTFSLINRLRNLGITEDDAWALRRVAMTLHRWHEMECGIDNGGVERDEVTGKTYWYNAMTGRRSPTPDRETGALKRLAAIMSRYPTLSPYVQGDPRGAALFLLRSGDIPEGQYAESYYSRGIAIYR